MTVYKYYSFLTLISAFCLFGLVQSAAADCNSLNQMAYKAYKAKSANQLRKILAQSNKECGDNDYIKNLTARVLFDKTEFLSADAQLKQLENIITFAPLNTKTAWLAREKQGDLLHDKGLYEPAFRAYESALNIIGMPSDSAENNKAKVSLKEAPGAKKILAIHKKAQRERLLTDSFIFSSRGDNTGVEMLGFKGGCVTEVALPITFDTSLSIPNNKGMEYTKQLKRMLDHYRQPEITITGHTDERNKTGKNAELSQARADFVKKYLEDKGYKNKIIAIGKSATEHFDDAEYEDYPKEKRWMLDRRVEVDFPKSVCDQ